MLCFGKTGGANQRRAATRLASLVALCCVGIGVAALAGIWSPEPAPRFDTSPILINGIAFTGMPIEVAPGDVVTLSATSADDDTILDGSSGSSTDPPQPDGATVLWTASDGMLSADRVSSGSSVQWTAPTLADGEDSRDVTVTAQADDDSTSAPGDPLDGHDPNRNDEPGARLVAQVKVKACKVTGASSNKSKVVPGESFTLTATGDHLDDVEWHMRFVYQPSYPPAAVENGATNTNTLTNPGRYVFRARCVSRPTSNAEVTLDVVDVDRVIRNWTSPEQTAGNGTVGEATTVRAMPNPPDASFPPMQPVWTIAKPVGSMVTAPGPGSTATVTPDVEGQYTITATCGMGTPKSYVLTVGGNRVESTVRIVMRDPAVDCQLDFDVSRGGGGYPNGLAKIIYAFDVTVGFDKNGPPKDIEIKAVAVSMFGSPAGDAGFTNVGSTFAAVGGIPVAKHSGDTQYTGAAANGCVVLDSLAPDTEPNGGSNGPDSPLYIPGDPGPFSDPARNYRPFRRIDANGRWFKVNYSISMIAGEPSLSVSGSQQSVTNSDAERTCP